MSLNNTAPQLRQFTFFDVSNVNDVHDPSIPPEIFKITPEISTIIYSTAGVLVADIHGTIHALTSNFEISNSWVAYPGGRATHMASRGSLLVTVGEDSPSSSAQTQSLKVWDLKKKDKKRSSMPLLLRSVKVKSGSRPHPVSSVALSKALTHFAIGFADGTVLIYRNFEQSIANSGSLTALPKAKVVHESPTEPITGLGFREPSTEDAYSGTHMYIVTTNKVLVYHVSGKGSGGTPLVVDEVGCALGCATIDRKGKDFIVAREEAIYSCGVEGRGSSFAYEGYKSAILSFMNYVVAVSPPLIPKASAPSKTVRNYVALKGDAVASDVTKVTIIDIENKIVAYSGTFEEGIREVFEGWGELYVLNSNGKLWRLQEKPTSVKMDILFEKKFYIQAIGIAKSQNLDETTVADIHRRYGDHFYTNKSDFDSAMHQYILTIGYLQPSYVIRKYLDAQRIHNLTTYLQELHARGLANSDHTTLLLNTYTKLKDNTRLDSFIRSKSHRAKSDLGGDDEDQPPFDLDTVIRVCRQAGYFDHAAYLAKKYRRRDDYLRIILDDKADFAEGLEFFRTSGYESASTSLSRYGRQMLKHLPEETTSLLIDLCTGRMPASDEDPKIPSQIKHSGHSAGQSYLSYLALNNKSQATPGLETPTPSRPNGANGAPLDRSSRPSEGVPSDTADSKPPTPAPTAQGRYPSEQLPSPKIFFAHFIGHHKQFIRFLEEVANRRWNQSLSSLALSTAEGDDLVEQKAVWGTLLELYLPLPTATSQDGGQAVTLSSSEKALELLKNDTLPYDPAHALMLCCTRSFVPGQILIWEKLGMHDDILRFWMGRHKQNDPTASAEVLRHLDMYGRLHPYLYRLVLRFLTSTSDLLARHREDVSRVLEYIEREKVMTPIEVVQVLSRNGVASVALVQHWLMTRIKESREELHTNRSLMDSYRSETNTKLQQLNELSDPNKPRVFQSARCSSCGAQMDLPAIHFMCNHSYHQRCLTDSESECPLCARANGIISEIRRNNARLADQQDLFVSEVRDNGFDSLAAGFGRGWLNSTKHWD